MESFRFPSVLVARKALQTAETPRNYTTEPNASLNLAFIIPWLPKGFGSISGGDSEDNVILPEISLTYK